MKKTSPSTRGLPVRSSLPSFPWGPAPSGVPTPGSELAPQRGSAGCRGVIGPFPQPLWMKAREGECSTYRVRGGYCRWEEAMATTVPHELVTTGTDITGYRVTRHLGVVRGITVRSRSIV